MPTYDYRCEKCGEDLEVYQSFSDTPLSKHDGCGGKLVKVLSPAGIVLKGTGFYKTDNRGSSKTAKEKTGDNGGGSSDTSGSKNTESKSDSSKPTTKNDSGSSTSKATASEAKSA